MEGLMGTLVALAIVLVIFLICRAIVLWYWKIDKIEEHLAAIRAALEKKG
jgi:hypothetical protein